MPRSLPASFHLSNFQAALLDWYDAGRRDLPWRRTDDPYKIWLSEVMLQQTQVATVIPYYERFLEAFPTPAALAAADQQAVLKMWEGLGYYARARNFHRAVNIVIEEYDGIIPSDPEKFILLPGVGEYVVAAVQSIAFGHPLAAVDGNVKRVVARLFEVKSEVNSSNAKKVFSEFANKLLYSERAGDFNQAMMEVGATVCLPRSPRCERCPLAQHCLAFENSSQTDYPRRTARKAVPSIDMVAAIIRKDDHLLLTKRADNALLGGLWEFPSIKLTYSAVPKKIFVNEFSKTLGCKIQPLSVLPAVSHAYTHFKVTLTPVLCAYVSGSVSLQRDSFRWITLDQLAHFPLPKVNHKFLPALQEAL